ncbi:MULTISPECIES: molybdate ABC transporter substrate-binding protein [unclassified Acidovorax]|uniref:molybdate ABC transporter substrate-binding protein n=1 Tax=unclassified Acidovorax TaxID=2684926 RepID=UPI001C48E55F|nr:MULTISPECIES: molybdate ABC transporter substrate-binding protein [unclassified Acidovorax]MBV7431291.1 molybdate ABC transporter substrate-binding protein [Acidovorax sp. sif0732]MBV7452397.1 molybdate ABC transporter substrate-binding protein [Acidovorax sp. sif0715]
MEHRVRTAALAAAVVCVLALPLAGCSTVAAEALGAEKAPVQVYAAGSLREAFTEIARDHEARTGQKVALTFGASGLLRERIEKGEAAQVFASADTDHPERLAARGGWRAPVVFTRNALCALTSEQISATPGTLLATLLRSDVRVGTSTPKADPSGDYAWALFRQADKIQPGAYAQLDAKALKLTGGADSPKPPAGRGTYAWVMDQRQADVFLTYCTNAVAAQAQVPRLRVVQLPPALQVGAAYGMAVRADAPAAAQAFATALRQPAAQAVLRRLGFGPP